jgi:phage repressor protein C with HTH and peptisase S24 domain
MVIKPDILKKTRIAKGLSQQEVADYIGVAQRTYSMYEDGSRNPKFDKVVLLRQILELNENVNVLKESKIEQPKEDFLTTRRNKKLSYNAFMVPLIPVKAQAGYIRAHDQTVFMDTLEKYALPPGVDPLGAIWAYWEVQGDSMEPTLSDGDYILATQVPRMDWDQLRNFYTYIIVTDERVLIKRIFCQNPLEWVLISDNEERYPQQLLPVEYVRQVWVFRRHINSKAPPPKKFEIKV